MRRKILSYDVSDETIFLFFSPLGNSILNLVLLSGRRRTTPHDHRFTWSEDTGGEVKSPSSAADCIPFLKGTMQQD
jgi:hypothetical protein